MLICRRIQMRAGAIPLAHVKLFEFCDDASCDDASSAISQSRAIIGIMCLKQVSELRGIKRRRSIVHTRLIQKPVAGLVEIKNCSTYSDAQHAARQFCHCILNATMTIRRELLRKLQ